MVYIHVPRICVKTHTLSSIPMAWLLLAAVPASPTALLGFCDERAAIFRRAHTWLTDRVPYDFNHFRDGFRTQCSGFVSFSWNLSIASPQVRDRPAHPVPSSAHQMKRPPLFLRRRHDASTWRPKASRRSSMRQTSCRGMPWFATARSSRFGALGRASRGVVTAWSSKGGRMPIAQSTLGLSSARTLIAMAQPGGVSRTRTFTSDHAGSPCAQPTSQSFLHAAEARCTCSTTCGIYGVKGRRKIKCPTLESNVTGPSCDYLTCTVLKSCDLTSCNMQIKCKNLLTPL